MLVYQNMQKNITKIIHYSCGYCINNMSHIFKNVNEKKRLFPAGVFLLKHKDIGYILFDTGYTTDIYNCGIIGKIYNILNPVYVKRKDMIDYKLRRDRINIEEIKYIILSHLHPDHIGGLKIFKNAKIIISKKIYKQFLKPKPKNLIFKTLFPNDIIEKFIILDDNELNTKELKYFSAYDIFGDSSINITNIDGHAYGEIVVLVNEDTFLAGDTCWGRDLLDKINDMKLFARMIQDDFEQYKRGIQILNKMKKNGIRLLFSHDTNIEKEVFNCEND